MCTMVAIAQPSHGQRLRIIIMMRVGVSVATDFVSLQRGHRFRIGIESAAGDRVWSPGGACKTDATAATLECVRLGSTLVSVAAASIV